MDPNRIERLKSDIADAALAVPGNAPLVLMEVCGTHTVAIRRSGLRSLLPERVRLVSGPGCPVCVTSEGVVDTLVDLAGREGVVLATFGDMVRVPGSRSSLEEEKAGGARVAVVYSVLEALDLARRRPDETVVFAAVGFETTAPGTAVALRMAREEGLRNFAVLSVHKWIVPAMAALLAGGAPSTGSGSPRAGSRGEVRIDGFLCPGHVSVVIGSRAYEPLAARHKRPCVVAGFTAEQVLAGVAAILGQLARREACVENVYPDAVRPEGNPEALRRIEEVFEREDVVWRGLGRIAGSGMALRPAYADFDAVRRLDLAWPPDETGADGHGCRCGDVIRGALEPHDCPLFGSRCTPAHPVGPCMVSREGSCQAEYRYGSPAERTRETP
jgi:hydrogenase expression/formation protein HypD